MQIPLLGGAYVARSVIANAQRCVNFYPERNPESSPAPFTMYQRPGLRPLVQGPQAPVRALYRASNGDGFAVIGQFVFYITPDFTLTQIGQLTDLGLGPARMIDNGIDILLVDSSIHGYTINLKTRAFAQINDITGAFTGGNVADYIDTFVVWNQPGTNLFGSTLSNGIEFDPLYVAGKSGYPDPIISLIVNRRQLLILGTLKSEIWYNAGNAQFPFAELPGSYIEHGCVATFSVACQDVDVYWLNQDLRGQGLVIMQRGYETKRISNHALEYAIQQMIAANYPIDNAIGYCYQQGGHVFYVLTFPSANETWVYDAAIQEPDLAWSQRAWTDAEGRLNRDRGNCGAYLYNINVVGDWQNGTLYQLDPSYFVDTVAGVDYPISFIRGFQHINQAMSLQGMSPTDGKQVQFTNFALDMDCGNVDPGVNGGAPLVWLRFSRDRGKTFGQAVLQQAGSIGEYLTQPQWGVIGAARDMVFEVGHSIRGPAAIQGAWIQAKVMGN